MLLGMDDKQKTQRAWIVATAVLLPVLYVASFGPACWMVDRGWIPVEPTAAVYSPVFFTDAHPVYEALYHYSRYFVRHPQSHGLFTAAYARHASRRLAL